MFSFHKPKIYRSNLGCCICKAKSSSSRFTDSKKYENEFERCFRIQEKRTGEICNACVLLVKRWKKLSPENRLTKHWHHVVDARAGPGTKLTGNRRIVNNNHHHQASGSSSSQSSSSRGQQQNKSANKSEVLPLSSSQAGNQSGSAASGSSSRGRTSSLSKARAIDTNVSTFTFGEPPSAYRRSYMSSEPAYSLYSSSASSSLAPTSTSYPFALSKPQSALNSSAFESVIKRFRQRQQQQHLEAQRRQQNRQQRLLTRQRQQQQLLQQQQHQQPDPGTSEAGNYTQESNDNELPLPSPAVKRVKRVSESGPGALASLESAKVASVLDGSIWRRERICCGIIFRGLYNEVAIFPKLLKPCECRLGKQLAASTKATNNQEEEEAEEEEEDEEVEAQRHGNNLLKKDITEPVSPPPRATKSGSISSSTSGTGSMEQPLEERLAKPASGRAGRARQPPAPAVAAAAKRPQSVPSKRRRPPPRQQQQDKDECDGGGSSEGSNLSSKESASAGSPSSSATSSDNSSSSRMMLLIDGEHVVRAEEEDDEDMDDQDIVDDDDEVDEEELVMADDDALESSNDASSTADSLVEIEEGKNPVTLPCNIYN